MKIYAFIYDGSDWDDTILFLNLDTAKEYAITRFCSRVRNGLLDHIELDDFHIEEFKYRSETSVFLDHSSKCLSLRMNIPQDPLEVHDMWNSIMNNEHNKESIFRTL